MSRYLIVRCRQEYDEVAVTDDPTEAARLLAAARAGDPAGEFHAWDVAAGCWSGNPALK